MSRRRAMQHSPGLPLGSQRATILGTKAKARTHNDHDDRMTIALNCAPTIGRGAFVFLGLRIPRNFYCLSAVFRPQSKNDPQKKKKLRSWRIEPSAERYFIS